MYLHTQQETSEVWFREHALVSLGASFAVSPFYSTPHTPVLSPSKNRPKSRKHGLISEYTNNNRAKNEWHIYYPST